MNASDPAAEKNTHNLNCVRTVGTYATHRLYLLLVAIKSSTLGNPGCFKETYQLRCKIEAAHLNTPRKHLLMAAASTAMAAVLGGWGCRAGQRFWESIGRAAPWCWTQMTSNLGRKFFSPSLSPNPRNPVLSFFLPEGAGRTLASSSSVQTAPSPKGPDN